MDKKMSSEGLAVLTRPPKAMFVKARKPMKCRASRQAFELCHDNGSTVATIEQIPLSRGDATISASTSGRSIDQPLPLNLQGQCLPRHIAIIMDGNARWASSRMLHINQGHRAGVRALKQTIQCCLKWGIPALTVYAFSSENWGRAEQEINFIMTLAEQVILHEVNDLVDQGVCVRFLGDRSPLPSGLQNCSKRLEEATAGKNTLFLNIALNYGGRRDIAYAAQNLMHQHVGDPHQALTVEEVEEQLSRCVGLSWLPRELREPDLLIRTGGEKRISNFLLWDLAYCELYFTDVHWPDFGEESLMLAIQDYCHRKRTFGRRS